MNELDRTMLSQLRTQSADMCFNDVGLGIEMEVPDCFQQHRASDDPIGVAHELCKQLELARLQINRIAAVRDRSLEQIQFDPTRTQQRRGIRQRRTPDEGIHAGRQLRERKRLYQIVITASIQSSNAVTTIAERGQKQHGCLYSGLTESLNESNAIEARQHAVNDQHVMASLARKQEAIVSVAGYVNHMSMLS
jgi:hypothetical protein